MNPALRIARLVPKNLRKPQLTTLIKESLRKTDLANFKGHRIAEKFHPRRPGGAMLKKAGPGKVKWVSLSQDTTEDV